MKKIITLLSIACAANTVVQAQNWQHDTFEFGGVNRIFKTYHANSTQQDMAVVLMLHGLGGTMNDVDVTNLKAIADTANLLLVSPQALDYIHPNPLLGNMGPAWNSGIKITGTPLGDVELNPTVNDVGFISALIDSVKANFNVDDSRIYIAGFSNGAFMTQRMLCEQPTLFRAAASHSGTKALPLTQCISNVKIPMAHFHGTTDQTVDLDGTFYMMGMSAPVGISADSLVNYWRGINNAPALSSTSTIGNQTAANYITHYEYTGDKRVEFFKIHNGGHQWYNYAETNNEFDLGIETWRFFLRADANQVGIANKNKVQQIGTYPNPVVTTLYVDAAANTYQHFSITDPSGRVVLQSAFNSTIDVQGLSNGLYILQLKGKDGITSVAKFVKN